MPRRQLLQALMDGEGSRQAAQPQISDQGFQIHSRCGNTGQRAQRRQLRAEHQHTLARLVQPAPEQRLLSETIASQMQHPLLPIPEGEAWGLDGGIYAPRDIFIVASSDGGASWSDPLNVSNTASLTDASVLYDRHGNGSGLANYPGDSDKATIFAAGENLVITWNDTYCGNGRHGPAKEP